MPLQFAEIEAWCRLSKTELDPWELEAILKLDNAYLASANKPTKVTGDGN